MDLSSFLLATVLDEEVFSPSTLLLPTSPSLQPPKAITGSGGLGLGIPGSMDPSTAEGVLIAGEKDGGDGLEDPNVNGDGRDGAHVVENQDCKVFRVET